MDREERFVKTYEQGGLVKGAMEIWVDTATGVNYLFRSEGYAGGLTPLLDGQGRPVVTPVSSVPRGPELK